MFFYFFLLIWTPSYDTLPSFVPPPILLACLKTSFLFQPIVRFAYSSLFESVEEKKRKLDAFGFLPGKSRERYGCAISAVPSLFPFLLLLQYAVIYMVQGDPGVILPRRGALNVSRNVYAERPQVLVRGAGPRGFYTQLQYECRRS